MKLTKEDQIGVQEDEDLVEEEVDEEIEVVEEYMEEEVEGLEVAVEEEEDMVVVEDVAASEVVVGLEVETQIKATYDKMKNCVQIQEPKI